jgi:hypothetical protein
MHRSPRKVIPTQLVLQGFFVECDQYNRAIIMFIDDYDLDDVGGQGISFTKSYILNKSNVKNGKSPLSNNTSFKVKYGKNKVGFINNQPVPLLDLKQHKVEIQVEIQHYNFTKMGNVIHGWNIKMNKMSLLEL